ncbi:hypothetical protein [Kitasatospora sp. NPDC004289]
MIQPMDSRPLDEHVRDVVRAASTRPDTYVEVPVQLDGGGEFTLTFERPAIGTPTVSEHRAELLAEVRRLRELVRDTTVSLETINDRLVFEEPDAADAIQAVIDRLNHRTAEGV